jgi:thioredoxin 2
MNRFRRRVKVEERDGDGGAPMADGVECPDCGRKNRVPRAAAGTPRCAHCKQRLPWVVDAGDDDFAEVADQAKVPVLVDLWAPWCGPCRMVSPALERLAAELAGRVKLVKVNVDRSPRLSQRFGAQAIPTLVLIQHGKEVARQIGAAPPPQLRAWLEAGLAEAADSRSSHRAG